MLLVIYSPNLQYGSFRVSRDRERHGYGHLWLFVQYADVSVDFDLATWSIHRRTAEVGHPAKHSAIQLSIGSGANRGANTIATYGNKIRE